MNNKMFILRHELYPGYPMWYVCEVRYYDNPNSYWVLGCTQTFKRIDAMEFGKKKAERIAQILYEQEDEEGYTHKWEVVNA